MIPAKAQTGSYHLDGLLEGPLGDAPDAQAKLADWVRIARASGYRFSLEVEGSGFGLLADTGTAIAPGGADVSEPLRDLLQQLARSFPLEMRSGLFSTVRSVQYGEDLETQTLYTVDPEGNVEAQQRTVDAITSKPTPPLTTKDKVRAGLIGAGVLAVLFGISALFFNWGDWFSSNWAKLVPVDAASIEMDLGTFEPYFEVTEKDVQGKTLRLTLKRKAAFPKSVEAVEALLAHEPMPFATRETLRALAAGYIRVEVLNEKGEAMGYGSLRITPLRTHETNKLKIGFSREAPPKTVKFLW